jgi:selenocysteine-specific elongation factor
MIVGTAGHIDHGKTTLVRALTGVDTDRLPEEKRRGITIDLGFAPLVLDGLGTVGVVDVPGHEAFVRTMLAGAAGIDVGLLVIAADDGVQPQTREHLAILELLGVRGGVIALTKCDLAEPDWIDLVEDDIATLVEHTAFAGAPIVRVAPGDVAALDAIRAALAAALTGAPARDPAEPFRLPVDRVFTVRGTGTVVTGTTWGGTIARDDEVRMLPSGGRARVRGVQVHGVEADRARPGQRTAVALVGVEVADIHRGDVLVAHPAWAPATVLRADVALLDDAPQPLGPRTAVRLHLGTAEVGARVVAQGSRLEPGQLRPVRLVLDAPVVARAGDRFVLRAPSPAVTIGGGVITDAQAARRSKPFDRAGMPLDERLSELLDEAGPRGLPAAALGVRLAAASGDLAPAIERAGAVELAGGAGLLVSRAAFDAARGRLLARLDEFHRAHPLATGASLQDLRMQLKLAPELAEAVILAGVEQAEIEIDRGEVRRKGWKPELSEVDEATLERVISRLSDAGLEPPDTAELVREFGPRAEPLLPVAVGRGAIVQVERTRYYTPSTLQQIIGKIGGAVARGAEISPAQIRELLGVSRKYVIPLLEYFDGVGLTSRRGETRLWVGRDGSA